LPLPTEKDVDDYATKVQGIIADLVSKNPCGWIVDLRRHGDGNVWAMTAGVGPILGEGELGKTKKYYENGKAGPRGGDLPLIDQA